MNAGDPGKEAVEDFREAVIEAKHYILNEEWKTETEDLASLIDARKNKLANATYRVRRLKALRDEERQEAAMVATVYDCVARHDDNVVLFGRMPFTTLCNGWTNRRPWN